MYSSYWLKLNHFLYISTITSKIYSCTHWIVLFRIFLVVCREGSCLIYVICVCLRIVITIWVTRRVSHKRQELLTLREHLDAPSGFLVGSVLLIFLAFCNFCCLRPTSCVSPFSWLFILGSPSVFSNVYQNIKSIITQHNVVES